MGRVYLAEICEQLKITEDMPVHDLEKTRVVKIKDLDGAGNHGREWRDHDSCK